MLILPLPARPDWSHPPVATLLIIVLCIVAFLMQGRDGERNMQAYLYYQLAGLDKIELPAYLQDLKQRGKHEESARLQQELRKAKGVQHLYRLMRADNDFMQRLHQNQVITPEHPDFQRWRSNRRTFDGMLARNLTDRYSLNPNAPAWPTLFTHMFLHGGLMHLLGNMAVLFIVAYTVEMALGPLGFLGLYLLGGIGATLPDLLFPPAEYTLSLGASGAISAVMAAYLVLFGWRRIPFFYWLFFFFGTVRWPALVILPIWLAKELLQRFVFDPDGHVNYLAHFAGFLTGAILIGLYRWQRHGRSAEAVHRQDTANAIDLLHQQACVNVNKLQFVQAAQDYRKLFAEHPEAGVALAEEYLRIAQLARRPELLAEAVRCLLRFSGKRRQESGPLPAAGEPAGRDAHRSDSKRIASTLAAVLLARDAPLPGLSGNTWEKLIRQLIVGGQLEAAEELLLRPIPRAALGKASETLLTNVAHAYEQRGKMERAAQIRAMQARLAALPLPRHDSNMSRSVPPA